MAIKVEFLKSIPYFAELDARDLEAVKGFVFEKTAERGELIILEGDSPKALYFVVSGAVKVYKTSVEGKEQILGIARPGDSFNDVAAFDGQLTPASAEAMGPVVLYGVTRDSMAAVLGDHPQVALNVARVLATRVRHMLELIEDLSFRHVIGRVARILLEYSENGADSRPRLTQREMAGMAGTAREVIGRSLRALEDEGAIKMERNRIIIADKDALRQMVEVSA